MSDSSKEIKYFESVGRRKEAVARARLFLQDRNGDLKELPADSFIINNKSYLQYFPKGELQSLVLAPLERLKLINKFKVSIKVKGGGIKGQAEAIKLAVARALIKFNPDFKAELKALGFLTRDPRMKERKKYGLKKARRAPQWSIR